MPWKIKKSGNKYCVAKATTGRCLGTKRYSSRKGATPYLRALYANVHESESVNEVAANSVRDGDTIKMSFKDFVDEHKRLVKVLANKNPQELDEEKREQEDELRHALMANRGPVEEESDETSRFGINLPTRPRHRFTGLKMPGFSKKSHYAHNFFVDQSVYAMLGSGSANPPQVGTVVGFSAKGWPMVLIAALSHRPPIEMPPDKVKPINEHPFKKQWGRFRHHGFDESVGRNYPIGRVMTRTEKHWKDIIDDYVGQGMTTREIEELVGQEYGNLPEWLFQLIKDAGNKHKVGRYRPKRFGESFDPKMKPAYDKAIAKLHQEYPNAEERLAKIYAYAGKNHCSVGEAAIALANGKKKTVKEDSESFNNITESYFSYFNEHQPGYWYGFEEKGPVWEYRAEHKNRVIALPSQNFTGRLLEAKEIGGKWYVRLESRPPVEQLTRYNLKEMADLAWETTQSVTSILSRDPAGMKVLRNWGDMAIHDWVHDYIAQSPNASPRQIAKDIIGVYQRAESNVQDNIGQWAMNSDNGLYGA